MSTWITAGNREVEGVPKDRLVTEELDELRRLMDARAALVEQIGLVEQRMELLVVAARDRRGIVGRVRVRPEDGRIEQEEAG